jgi:DNA end-binding protein Ku
MERRPVWRGQLRLALVSCPVALFTAAHQRASLHFHFINPKTGHRVRSVTRDAETDEDVSRSDLVKGYEFKKDHYLLMSDEDFASAKTESSSVMKIEKFVEQSAIDPIYYDSSYYLMPDGDAGEEIYAVLQTAIEKTGMAALTRVVMAQRERVVALRIIGKGIVAHTLHEPRDLNDPQKMFDELPTAKPDADMIKLAEQLIERQTGPFDAKDFEDRYEQRLRAVIDAKLKGEGVEPEEEDEGSSNVIDLMAALRQSLGQSGKEAKPAKAAAKPAAKPAARKKAR